MQLPKIFQAFKNLESKKKIYSRSFGEKSHQPYIEEIEMRFTMCGMLTKNNIYNSEIYAKKKRIFEKYPIMEDFLITDFSY